MRPTDGAPRILIADDDAGSLDLLVSYLETLGYRVDAATDGNRALELGTTKAYDLVILDINMPMYDGLELVQILRRRHLVRAAPMIAVTADVSGAARDAAQQAGFDSFMSKPIDLKLVRKEIQTLLWNEGATVRGYRSSTGA